VAFQSLIPKLRQTFERSNFERITQPITDFVRGNPIISGVSLGAGGSLATLAVAGVVRRAATRRKKKKSTTKRKTRKRKSPAKRRGKKKTQTQIRAMRLRNLAKARRARKTGKRKGIIRGRGLGRREIKHSGKGTRGKFKVVSFRNKKTGKMVRFKTKR